MSGRRSARLYPTRKRTSDHHSSPISIDRALPALIMETWEHGEASIGPSCSAGVCGISPARGRARAVARQRPARRTGLAGAWPRDHRHRRPARRTPGRTRRPARRLRRTAGRHGSREPAGPGKAGVRGRRPVPRDPVAGRHAAAAVRGRSRPVGPRPLCRRDHRRCSSHCSGPFRVWRSARAQRRCSCRTRRS